MISYFGDTYPFIKEHTGLSGYIRDFYICEKSYNSISLPVTLSAINTFGGLFITLKDSADVTVYSGSMSESTCNITGYSLYTGTSSIATVWCLVSDSLSINETDSDYELDSRVVNLLPKHITSIKVGNSYCSRNIKLVGGNNIDLASSAIDNDNRNVTEITIEASPGTGTGRSSSDCEEESGISSLNGFCADENNNLKLNGTDCYDISSSSHSLSLRNDCSPCCKCEDFTTTGEYLDALAKDYYQYGEQVDYLKGAIEDLIEEWTEKHPLIDEEHNNLVEVIATVNANTQGFLLIAVRNITDKVLKKISLHIKCDDRYTYGYLVAKRKVVNGPDWSVQPEMVIGGGDIGNSIQDDGYFKPLKSTTVYWDMTSWPIDKGLLPGQSVYVLYQVEYLVDIKKSDRTINYTVSAVVYPKVSGYALENTAQVKLYNFCSPLDQVDDPTAFDYYLRSDARMYIRDLRTIQQGNHDCLVRDYYGCDPLGEDD